MLTEPEFRAVALATSIRSGRIVHGSYDDFKKYMTPGKDMWYNIVEVILYITRSRISVLDTTISDEELHDYTESFAFQYLAFVKRFSQFQDHTTFHIYYLYYLAARGQHMFKNIEIRRQPITELAAIYAAETVEVFFYFMYTEIIRAFPSVKDIFQYALTFVDGFVKKEKPIIIRSSDFYETLKSSLVGDCLKWYEKFTVIEKKHNKHVKQQITEITETTEMKLSYYLQIKLGDLLDSEYKQLIMKYELFKDLSVPVQPPPDYESTYGGKRIRPGQTLRARP